MIELNQSRTVPDMPDLAGGKTMKVGRIMNSVTGDDLTDKDMRLVAD